MQFLTMMTKKNIELLLEIEKKVSVTSRSQLVYPRYGFFMNVGGLSDAGLIISEGKDNLNRKIWKLTSKGKKFMDSLREADKIYQEELK